MKERGFSVYEGTVYLFIISILVAGVAALAMEQFKASRIFFQNSALQKSLDTIYSNAELLTTGSQIYTNLIIPKGISNVSLAQRDELWVLGFYFEDSYFERPSKVKVVFIPHNMLENSGTHKVVIQKESGRSAVVKEV